MVNSKICKKFYYIIFLFAFVLNLKEVKAVEHEKEIYWNCYEKHKCVGKDGKVFYTQYGSNCEIDNSEQIRNNDYVRSIICESATKVCYFSGYNNDKSVTLAYCEDK